MACVVPVTVSDEYDVEWKSRLVFENRSSSQPSSLPRQSRRRHASVSSSSSFPCGGVFLRSRSWNSVLPIGVGELLTVFATKPKLARPLPSASELFAGVYEPDGESM